MQFVHGSYYSKCVGMRMRGSRGRVFKRLFLLVLAKAAAAPLLVSQPVYIAAIRYTELKR